MTELNIAARRLSNQRLASTAFREPAQVVAWLGAVQAQEYALAKWALGLRITEATDSAIEQAFAAGALLRTHVMRPTWHFVTPADIRWLLALTAPRVHALLRAGYRELELDDALRRRARAAIAGALQGGRHLTRPEIGAVVAKAGIEAVGRRLSYLMMHAELEGLVCSGPRRGKQFTYALLDERVPAGRMLSRDEALAELVRRYFTSHGPAMIKDFVWWSGLTVADTKAGLAALGSTLSQDVRDGQTYWFPASSPDTGEGVAHAAYLLPPFDEYTNYRDLAGVLDPAHRDQVKNTPFSGTIVMAGHIIGKWRRTFNKGAIIVEQALLRPLSAAETNAVATAAERFGEFLQMPVVLT